MNKRTTYNVSGGQINIANGNSIINATQYNLHTKTELDAIIKGVMDNLSELPQEDSESIKDLIEMAKDEFNNREPKKSRLRNCVTLLAPMITIANGFPVLCGKLHELVDFISRFL